jgi:hypothetical protein
MGWLLAFATLPRFICPQIIPHKFAVVEAGTCCTLCTGHPCSNCYENLQEAHCITYLSNIQAELVFFHFGKIGVHFMFCSMTVSHMPNFTFHASMPKQWA